MYISDNVKKWFFLAAGLICLTMVFCLTALFRGAFASREEVIPITETPVAAESSLGEQKPEKWAVYVTGEVAAPGVYEISPGSRINDAVRLAGGFTSAADRNAVNLAEKLRDEAHIIVPNREAAESVIPRTPEKQADVPARQTNAPTGPVTKYPGGNSANGSDGNKIDINSADSSRLATLPGIGPKLSSMIVSYREENGPFKDIEALRNVSGIGEKRFEAIKDLIMTGNK